MYVRIYVYCMLLSERHVVSFISTFSDVHSVDVLHFLFLLPPDGFVLCYIGLLVLTLWRFDDDVIGPSPGMGLYSWYQSYRVRTLRPGVGHVVHSACSTSIHAICCYKEIH